LPLDLTKDQIEEIIMKDERTLKQLEGRTPNKVIIVPGKIINLVGYFFLKIDGLKSKSNCWGLDFFLYINSSGCNVGIWNFSI
jgi:hypothetical protein